MLHLRDHAVRYDKRGHLNWWSLMRGNTYVFTYIHTYTHTHTFKPNKSPSYEGCPVVSQRWYHCTNPHTLRKTTANRHNSQHSIHCLHLTSPTYIQTGITLRPHNFQINWNHNHTADIHKGMNDTCFDKVHNILVIGKAYRCKGGGGALMPPAN
jgi:hypothetical protein